METNPASAQSNLDALNAQFPLGAQLSPRDRRTLIYENLVSLTGSSKRTSFRHEQSPVITQHFGSCVGRGEEGGKEAEEMRERGALIELSGRFLYAMCKANDGIPTSEGTYPRVAMSILHGIGIARESDWPSDEGTGSHEEYIQLPPQHVIDSAHEFRIDGFTEIVTLQGLKDAIDKYHEVGISFNVYDTFDGVGSDGYIAPHNKRNYRGRHWVLAVGYDDERGVIEFKNTWGKRWGNKGYGYISYDYEGVGALPFNEAYVAVDFVDGSQTAGAPVNLAYPVRNPYVTQPFGANPKYYAPLKGHNGIDFRLAVGGDVLTTDDGEVTFAGWGGSVSGNVVLVKHSWGVSYYGHLSGFEVRVGQRVSKGQLIAKGGATGQVTGAHLHFMIKINGVKNPGYNDWVNAAPYLKAEIMATKRFRIKQGNKMGIVVAEGFACTILFENDWLEYQTLLRLNGMNMSFPLIEVPDGHKFLRLNDHGKLGILVIDGFAGTGLFENDWAEYQEFLRISAVTDRTPMVSFPN